MMHHKLQESLLYDEPLISNDENNFFRSYTFADKARSGGYKLRINICDEADGKSIFNTEDQEKISNIIVQIVKEELVRQGAGAWPVIDQFKYSLSLRDQARCCTQRVESYWLNKDSLLPELSLLQNILKAVESNDLSKLLLEIEMIDFGEYTHLKETIKREATSFPDKFFDTFKLAIDDWIDYLECEYRFIGKGQFTLYIGEISESDLMNPTGKASCDRVIKFIDVLEKELSDRGYRPSLAINESDTLITPFISCTRDKAGHGGVYVEAKYRDIRAQEKQPFILFLREGAKKLREVSPSTDVKAAPSSQSVYSSPLPLFQQVSETSSTVGEPAAESHQDKNKAKLTTQKLMKGGDGQE